jgi:hypothetical protein
MQWKCVITDHGVSGKWRTQIISISCKLWVFTDVLNLQVLRLQKSCHSHTHYIPKKPPNYASKAKRDTPPKSHKSTKKLNAPWVISTPPKKKAQHCKYGVSYKTIALQKKATNSFIVSQHTLSAS